MENPAEIVIENPDRSRTLPVTEAFQRMIEVLGATLILLLALPIMVAVAAVIKTGSPGGVFFFQDRVGRGGKTFRFVKFRTMYVDARERFPELYRYAYDNEQMKTLVFKVKDDPRLTPQGRWLRKTSLDELPNFWNVLTGDMAFVGPRPEIPQMLPYYPGELRKKFSVRPGVTGLAQVSGRGNLTFRETAELDLQYVRQRSWRMDLYILLKSVKSVLLAVGAS
jgi:lipopolysaccharide/colanic/teichoic acid biosynthesis glycosyltransferase